GLDDAGHLLRRLLLPRGVVDDRLLRLLVGSVGDLALREAAGRDLVLDRGRAAGLGRAGQRRDLDVAALHRRSLLGLRRGALGLLVGRNRVGRLGLAAAAAGGGDDDDHED